MHEIDAIRAIRDLFPASPRQRNALFACDAELVELGSQVYGLSMDEFSAEEDFFPGSEPEILGRNLAVAVIADVLAAGCLPEFYMHSIAEPPGTDGFSLALCRGVASVLAECGCFLLGGDLGRSAHAGGWRYTGLALGRPIDARTGALTRILPPRAQALWITGSVGDGNVCALSGVMPVFEPRLAEARAICGQARACMDTSGGLAESLLTLRRLNPGHRFIVNPAAIPYAASAVSAAKTLGLPVEGFAFAGAGEYEVLFATDESAVLDCATRIGTAVPAPEDAAGVFWGERPLPPELPDPRSFSDTRDYIRQLLQTVRSCLA